MAQAQTASFSRRLVAICLDWAGASLISAGFFGYDSVATLIIYAAMQILLVGLLGFSIGHRIMGLRVIRLDGLPIGLWRAFVRTILIILVIPAFIWSTEDGRGLQDKAARTAIVRR